jgi:hypothetical protein
MTATRLGPVLAAVLLGGVVVLGSSSTAEAAPVKCPASSLKKEIKQADVVFRGMVDQARKVRGTGADRTRTYTVTADRIYQASLVTNRVRVTAELGAKCPPPDLAEGKRYIFFVTEQGSRLVSTSATSKATHRLTQQVEAKLGSGKPVESNPPLDVQFTKVADAAPPGLSRLLAPGAAVLVLSLLGLLVVGRVSRHP